MSSPYAEAMKQIAELRRLGIKPAEYNLASPWQRQVRVVDINNAETRKQGARP